MVSGTTQKTEDFEVRKNWVLGCGDLIVIKLEILSYQL